MKIEYINVEICIYDSVGIGITICLRTHFCCTDTLEYLFEEASEDAILDSHGLNDFTIMDDSTWGEELLGTYSQMYMMWIS